MLRLTVVSAWRRSACKICTLMVLVCLLTSSAGAVPVLSSIVAPGSQPPPEELETHSDVRINCPRQQRVRSIPDAAVAPVPDRFALAGFHYLGRQPQALLQPCFIGSGIRLLC